MSATAWFTSFKEDLNKKLDHQTENFDGKIDNLTDTVSNLQQSVQAAEEKRKKEAEKTNRKNDLLRTQQTLTDDLEVLILGLPIAFSE